MESFNNINGQPIKLAVINTGANFSGGSGGGDGREVQLQANATHIQWRYVGDASWINLVALADLEGADGDNGLSLEFAWNGTQLGVRQEGQVDYVFVDLKGDTGYTPVKGTDYDDGADGREVEIQNSGTAIQWRYVGDAAWTDVVSLAAITGSNGKSVELQTTATHIQWRLVGDPTWINLIALSELKGDDGYTPVKGVDYDDGADGVSVTITATTDQAVFDNATPTATELVVLYDA